jgi:hypothetical protein
MAIKEICSRCKKDMELDPLKGGCICNRSHSQCRYAIPSRRYHDKEDYFSDDGNYVQRKEDKA